MHDAWCPAKRQVSIRWPWTSRNVKINSLKAVKAGIVNITFFCLHLWVIRPQVFPQRTGFCCGTVFCPSLFLQRVSKGIIVVTLPSWSLQSVLVSNVLAAPSCRLFNSPIYVSSLLPLEDRNALGFKYFPQRHLPPSWFPSSFQNYVLFQAWANLLRTWLPTLGFYPNNSLQILDCHDSPHVSVGHRSLLYFHTF